MAGLATGARLARRLTLGLLLACWALLAPVPALAAPGSQAPASPGAEDRARIEALVATLEDAEQRARLVGQLRLLLQAQPQSAAQPDGLGDAGRMLLGTIVLDLTGTLQRLFEGLRPASVVERLLDWGDRTFLRPEGRSGLLDFMAKFFAVFGIGLLAEQAVRRALRRPSRRVVELGEGAGPGERAWRFILATLLLVAPLVAFALAASVVAPSLPLRPLVAISMSYLVAGYLLLRFVRDFADLVLAPGDERWRPVPAGQATASYVHAWVYRFATFGIVGSSLLAAAQPLGIPFVVHDALQRVLGLVLVGLAIVLVLQNREAVAASIGRSGEAAEAGQDAPARMLAIIRAFLAGTWHVLAIAYLLLGYAVWALEIRDGARFLAQATFSTIAVLVAAKLASAAQRRFLARMFRATAGAGDGQSLLAARAGRYRSVLAGLADMAIVLLAMSAILSAWGLRGFYWLTTDAGAALAGRLASLAAVVALAIVAWEVASALIERRLRQLDAAAAATPGAPRSQRLRTFLPLMRNAIFVVIVAIAGLSILSEIGVNVAPLLAGAGVIGVAIGFGSQTLVKDVITGLFILFEDTVNVGDVVDLDGGHAGTVESLSIRSIRLRDVSGAQHTIPFSQVGTIKNMTKDFAFYVFDLSVAYATDMQKVVEALRSVDAAARAEPDIASDVLEPIEILGLDRFGDFALVVRARIKTRPGRQWRVGRIYNERIKLAFDGAGIEIPYPHRVEIQKRIDPPRPAEAPEAPEGAAPRAAG
jgi:small conductance mechanosensitive channel